MGDSNQKPLASGSNRKKIQIDFRCYCHDSCGKVTKVQNHISKKLANPFIFQLGSYCAYCERTVPLKGLRWGNTQDSISDLRKKAIFKTNWLLFLVLLLSISIQTYFLSHLITPHLTGIQILTWAISFVISLFLNIIIVIPILSRVGLWIDYRKRLLFFDSMSKEKIIE